MARIFSETDFIVSVWGCSIYTYVRTDLLLGSVCGNHSYRLSGLEREFFAKARRMMVPFPGSK